MLTMPLTGTLDRFPGDKSISHRALLLASLSARPIRLHGVNLGGAVLPLVAGLRQLGVRITEGEKGLEVQGGTELRGGQGMVLNMGPSSAAARLLIGLLAGLGVAAVVDGDHVLRTRPMEWIVEPLNLMGAKIRYLDQPGRLPIEVASSPFAGGRATLQVASAQALSAVLLAGFAATRRVELRTIAHTRDHTERLLRSLGVEIVEENGVVASTPREAAKTALARLPEDWTIPGDPSAAAYLAAACFLSGRPEPVVFSGLGLNPTRLGFFSFLKACGAAVSVKPSAEIAGEPVGVIEVAAPHGAVLPVCWSGKPRVHSMIDEIPLAAAVAAFAGGTSRFDDCEELVFKETNRLETTCELLRACGAGAAISGSSIIVRGGTRWEGRDTHHRLPSYADHRIAMTATVIASVLGWKAVIEGGRCYETSFHGFPEAMRKCGFAVRVCGTDIEVN